MWTLAARLGAANWGRAMGEPWMAQVQLASILHTR